MARIAGVDIPRDKRTEIALTYVFGVGRSTALTITDATGIDRHTRVKDLTDDEVMRGDVDGDTQFDANDSFLVHLVQLSGTDEQIDLSKGGSGLTVAEIRDKIGQLNPDGDVDGDSDFDANDSFLIHLVQLSGTDSQVDQSKGGSSLTASEIRARVSALRADSVGSTGTAKRTAKLLPAVPSGDDYSALDIALFGVTPVERERFQQTCSEEPKSAFGSAESSTGFRSWIDAL